MPNELDPIIGQWYSHLDKGQRFCVTAVDEDNETVEVQHFDGDLEEYGFEDWKGLAIVLCEEPESWAGSVDITEKDDYGTEVTDTKGKDWSEAGEEFHGSNKKL